MVGVPAGRFTMGSPEGELDRFDMEDQLSVTIGKPFAVGRFAVTRGEFAAFIRPPATRPRAEAGPIRGVSGSYSRIRLALAGLPPDQSPPGGLRELERCQRIHSAAGVHRSNEHDSAPFGGVPTTSSTLL